jgi:hypothetical protein
MSVFMKKTSQSKILDQLSTSEDTLSRSSSDLTKSDQTFNESDLTFDEFVSSSAETFVAVEISEKKETINLFRKDQSMNKKINIFFRKESFLCSKISKMSKNLSKIEDVLLNVLTSRNIDSRIDVINIINDKRTRKQRFANAI